MATVVRGIYGRFSTQGVLLRLDHHLVHVVRTS